MFLQGFFQPLLTVGYPSLPKKNWYFGGFFKSLVGFFKGFGWVFSGFGWVFQKFGWIFQRFLGFVFQTQNPRKSPELVLNPLLVA